MRFEHPHLLWFLLLLAPGLIAFQWWAWRRRQQLIAQFVQSRLLAQLTVGVSPLRQKVRMALVSSAACLLVVVLARPQWGFEWEEARQRGLDIIIGIDTSRSMLATDAPPNRLDRAKLAAQDLLRAARTDRLGLVAFAGAAFLQCPLTIDDGAFRQSLEALDTSIIPQGGTALAEAIRTAQTAFGEENDNFKILVLFTDGEDHDGTAVQAAREAAQAGMRIFTVGVGTAEGELLALPDGRGGTDLIKDAEGNVVMSRLNDSLLQNIAKETDGLYVLLAGANPIDRLYKHGLDPLPKSEFAARRIKRYHERYQWFLALSLVLLAVEVLLPDRRRVSRSPTQSSGQGRDLFQKVSLILLVPALSALTHSLPAAASTGSEEKTALSELRPGQDQAGKGCQAACATPSTPSCRPSDAFEMPTNIGYPCRSLGCFMDGHIPVTGKHSIPCLSPLP